MLILYFPQVVLFCQPNTELQMSFKRQRKRLSQLLPILEWCTRGRGRPSLSGCITQSSTLVCHMIYLLKDWSSRRVQCPSPLFPKFVHAPCTSFAAGWLGACKHPTPPPPDILSIADTQQPTCCTLRAQYCRTS